MFPNSANASFTLLTITSVVDEVGVKKLTIEKSKELIGCLESITSGEFQTSVALNKKFDLKVKIQAFLYDESKYVLIKGKVYKIERTYNNGQFIELYMSLSEINYNDLYGRDT